MHVLRCRRCALCGDIDGRLHPDHRIGHVLAAGDTVGHLWVARENDSSWYVWDIAIDTEHQGRGYGRAAMKLAEEMALADRATGIGLSVLASNDTARALYRSMGYEEVGPQHRPLLRMSKRLAD